MSKACMSVGSSHVGALFDMVEDDSRTHVWVVVVSWGHCEITTSRKGLFAGRRSRSCGGRGILLMLRSRDTRYSRQEGRLNPTVSYVCLEYDMPSGSLVCA